MKGRKSIEGIIVTAFSGTWLHFGACWEGFIGHPFILFTKCIGGHRNPLAGPGVAIETPSLAGGGHRNPLAGRGWPSKPPRWPGVAIETPSLAGGWPSKPPRWPGVAIETPSLAGGGHRNPLAGRGWPSKPPLHFL